MTKNRIQFKDTKKFISGATCISFLRLRRIGNLSDKEGFWTSQNDRKRTSGCLFTDELLSKKTRIRNLQSTIHNEKGIALVMILVLSAIALAIMAGLIYMITSGTQISGMEKRYKTALEAGLGGIDVTYHFIGKRGDPEIPGINFNFSSAFTSACMAAKLNTTTSTTNWAACSNYSKATSLTIDTTDPTSYDMSLQLGTAPFPTYNVYTKIVDTVEGNSGGDEGLLGKGVVASGTGEVTVVSRPYLYTIEVDAQDQANPAERAKLSILYQY